MGTDDLSFVHDESGRVTNANVNGFAYDYVYAAQRTQVSDENGRTVRFVSNDDGLTTDVENWLGTVTSIETDSAGRPQVLRRNDQVESSVDYGSNRNNASPRSQYIRSPENGEPITITFDKYGRVKAVESPDKNSTLQSSLPIIPIDLNFLEVRRAGLFRVALTLAFFFAAFAMIESQSVEIIAPFQVHLRGGFQDYLKRMVL